jgi:feruloyl-CoA synthase
VPLCRDLCRNFDAGASVRAVLDHPAVRSRFQSVLDEIASRGTGSSTVVDRALLLVEPPSIDAREITDKGSINQKAVLQNRSGLVEELYAESTSPRVIHAWSATSRVPTSHQ